MSMDNEFASALERVLEDIAPPDAVRAIDQGGSPADMWQGIVVSGFLDALVPEPNGAGLGLRDAGGLIVTCGRFALPVPVVDTMGARALLAEAGHVFPEGPICLATGHLDPDGTLVVTSAAVGGTSAYALVAVEDRLLLLDINRAERTPTGTRYDLARRLAWPKPEPLAVVAFAAADFAAFGATLAAAQAAGGLERIFQLTLGYADERKQFGKPIGGFQAVQQQISVMSEHVAAAAAGVRLAMACDGLRPTLRATAAAKIVVAEAIRIAVPIAHGVHAAIGISAEHDLHLWTRRLHHLGMAFGSEALWARRLGEARVMASGATLAFIRGIAEDRNTAATMPSEAAFA